MQAIVSRAFSALAVVAALVTGCSGRPALQEVEPVMQEAVRAVVGPQADLGRELFARCGPADEPLDGLRLQLTADVPAGSVDVDEAATELWNRGLDVEVADGTGAPLLAVTSDDGWTAELRPGQHGAWRLTARAEVDGDAEDAGGPVRPCG